MARRSKLLTAPDVYQVEGSRVGKHKLIQKKAAKRKEAENSPHKEITLHVSKEVKSSKVNTDAEPKNWEAESAAKVKSKSNHLPSNIRITALELLNSDQIDQTRENLNRSFNDDSKEEADPSDDVPFSDVDEMSETDQADLIPHQRLIINNTTALLSAQALLTQNSSSKCPFSSAQAITSSSAVVDSIFDVEDDFTRELAFYQQCLDAANQARMLLKKEGFLFSRPHDFFAEMVKSDDHMDKIKRKMADEAAAKKASAEAKRQRDLRRFGKQVQIVKGQERDKERRTALNKIETLKRKRRQDSGLIMNPDEDDVFDVALENTDKSNARTSRKVSVVGSRALPMKRHRKDAKFGFGGKSRLAKRGDALSSGDLRDFSVQKMKGSSGSKRLGKSRRANKAAT